MNPYRSWIEKFFKNTIMHNFGYKVLSVVIAVMAWLVIINIADPVTTRNFSNLQVEIRNQNAIASINQVYEIVEGSTIDFTVRGKTSVVKNLKISDFTAYSDLSQLSPVYAADIKVECNKNEQIEIDTGNKMLVVKLEDIASKNVQVAVETIGDVADGYYVGDYEVKPNMITVSGAVSRIEKLEAIRIAVNVAGAKKSFSTKHEPVAFDRDGNVMESKYFTFANSNTVIKQVNIDVTIYKTKTIPVMLEISGKPADGYVYNNEYEYTPQTIVVGGMGKRLNKLNSLTIPVDITGADEEYEENVNIDSYLPDNIKLVSNEQSIAVRVKLEKLITKTIFIEISDIKLDNIPSGLRAEFAGSASSVEMRLIGTKEQLNDYTSSNVGAYIDLSDKEEGDYFIQPECKNVPDDIYSVRPGVVNVRLVDINTAQSTDKPDNIQDNLPNTGTGAPAVTDAPAVEPAVSDTEG